jgi:hypothetical protein
MYTHTQDSIFCKINIFIIEYLLLGIGIDWTEHFPEKFRENDTHHHLATCELGMDYFVSSHFLVDRFEILF